MIYNPIPYDVFTCVCEKNHFLSFSITEKLLREAWKVEQFAPDHMIGEI